MAIFLDKSDTVLRQIFGHFWCCIFRVCLQLCENFYLQRWFQMQQLFLQVCRNNTKICSRVKRWTFALITITWATLTFSEIEGCCAKYFCEGALPRPFFNFQRLQSSFYSRYIKKNILQMLWTWHTISLYKMGMSIKQWYEHFRDNLWD